MKKGFIKNLFPDFTFLKLTDIGPDFFSGAQLIIFDADNTLVFSETTETKKEIIDWFFDIRKRYKCLLISNSRTIIKRREKISELLGCEVFLSRHKKPSQKLFREIKEKYDFENSKIYVVGDRIFTDILFGNLNDAKTVLVKPLGKKEKFLIKVTRKIENFLLFLFGLLGYDKR